MSSRLCYRTVAAQSPSPNVLQLTASTVTVERIVQYPFTSFPRLRRKPSDPLAFLDHLAQFGDLVSFRIGQRSAVLLNRPEYVTAVLTSHASKFPKSGANARARRLLGDGLLTADTALNRERRKLIQPAFSKQRLDHCASIVVARTRTRCEAWSDGDVLDVIDAIGSLTFGIVSETIVGARVPQEFGEVRQAVAEATASIDPLLSIVAPLNHVRRAQATLRALVERLVLQPAHENRGGSLLELLDAHGEGASAEQRIDDVLTILLAGHDTITSALTWAWSLLSRHPEAEAAMREELDHVLGDRDVTADDVARLAYTRAVFAESLRLFPPAWVLARESAEAQTFDGSSIPRGTIVLLSQYLLHRDGRYFDRPRAFNPTRWLSNADSVPRGAFFPFGLGARSCIGESFGWMEGVLILATIARRWRLRLVNSDLPTVDARITLRPRAPVLMRLAKSGHC